MEGHMTTTEARVLRDAWHTKGDQPCTHEQLKLTRMMSGHITGDYTCAQCGSNVLSPD